MKLHNDFSPYIRSLFADIQPFCQKCNSNQQCAIHHIYGRRSSSMLNGITLCGECHRVADGFNTDGFKGKKVRQDLLFLTLTAFYKNTWWEKLINDYEKQNNREFLTLIHTDFECVAKRLML